MSLQAYLDNIQVKTGKSPDDLKALAKQKGFLQNGKLVPTVKATDVTNWLKEEFELGHGHAMAIWSLFLVHYKQTSLLIRTRVRLVFS